MKKIIISLLIVSFFISSCARSYDIDKNESKLQFYDRINKKCLTYHDFVLKKKDGGKIRVNSFTLSPDSTLYSEFELGTAEYIKTSELSQIEFYHNSKLSNACLGMGLGAAIGVPASIGLIQIFNPFATGEQAFKNIPIMLCTIIISSLIGYAIVAGTGPDIIKLQQ